MKEHYILNDSEEDKSTEDQRKKIQANCKLIGHLYSLIPQRLTYKCERL